MNSNKTNFIPKWARGKTAEELEAMADCPAIGTSPPELAGRDTHTKDSFVESQKKVNAAPSALRCYPSIRDGVTRIPTEDAERIRYILESTLAYINEVGPRNLLDHKDEVEAFIAKLPQSDNYTKENT